MPDNSWTNQVAIAITVTDSDGKITEMNPVSIATFAADGGARLVGSDVFACHPEPSRTKLAAMYKAQQPNHYTIQKNGKFSGYVEISIPIPEHLPHFNRD